MQRQQAIQSSIIRDLAEGVIAVRFDGVIELVNDAALRILGRSREELEGRRFAAAFFTDEENDAFIQCVLDAVYNKDSRMESYVPYRLGDTVRQLRVVSSFLRGEDGVIGVILLVSDITELNEMRDAVRAMNTIQALNRKLELRNRVLQETFGRYLSDDIVREILDSPEGWKLGGQKRRLTVMMSDLRGFTAMSERMEPQALIAMVNHYFGVMYEEIERRHGVLIEFLGDGMFVIFGAPAPSETHAADAVAAALGMQRRMEEVNSWNRERGYEELAMGIGIHTAEVILGNIGSEKRTKYGVLGAAVNLTGRIESYSTGGQVLISPDTRAAIREPLSVARSFEVLPKGLREPISISEVAGIGAPYEVYLGEKPAEAALRPVKPTQLRFTVLDGKHAEGAGRSGRILAVSEHGALLETEESLSLYSDLRFELGSGLYAKVLALEEGRARVGFTALPQGFGRWLEDLETEAGT